MLAHTAPHTRTLLPAVASSGVRLGFGVSGPLASGLVSARATRALVRHAHDLGVRVFDVAPSYGDGEAERRLGDAIAGLRRDRIFISTKAGIGASGARDFSADGVRRSLDASLTRLKLERIDALFLHGPAPHEIDDALLSTLVDLRDAGRVGVIGVAGRGHELDVAFATNQIPLVMAPVNARLPADEQARLARLRASGAQILGIETLAGALPRYPAPTGVGAFWRLARSLMRAPRDTPRSPSPAPSQVSGPASPAPSNPADAIAWALGAGGADMVITTTTRARRLAANLDAARPGARLDT